MRTLVVLSYFARRSEHFLQFLKLCSFNCSVRGHLQMHGASSSNSFYAPHCYHLFPDANISALPEYHRW